MFAAAVDWLLLDDALLALWLLLLLLQPTSTSAATMKTITLKAPSIRLNMTLSS